MLSKVPKDYRDADLFISGSNALDIRVSIAQVDHALLLMDTFIKIIQQCGHHFEITDRASFLVVWRSKFALTLKEGTAIIPDKDSRRRPTFIPNGIFNIQFDHWSKMTIKDGQKLIEQQLAKLVARLEIKAMEELLWLEENERQRALKEEKERQQKLLTERKKSELEAFERVIESSQRWKITETVKAYVAAVEQNALETDNITAGLSDWVKKKIDWFDPMVDAKDDWLTEIDRDSLLARDKSKQSSTYGRNSQGQPMEKSEWPLLPW